jgi:glycosyltransferase involved in cell wall biosynthesis
MSNKLNILYVGNNLASKTKYKISMEILSELLVQENYSVQLTSNKQHKLIRIFDMCLKIIGQRKTTHFVLIDTFSTTNFYFAFIVSQLSRIFELKYIPILRGGDLPSRLAKSQKMCKMIFKNSYKNIAPSNYLKKEFEKKGFKVDYIPNVIPIQKYNFKIRNKIQPNLLYVRAFAKFYNPIMAVQVLFELKKVYKNAKLCMIGPDKDGTLKEVELMIIKLNLKESVEITGVLSKEAWHKKSEEYDVFINTTNVDNTPISVIEAMALGLPVISTNVGGIPYLLENNVDGILVAPNSIKEMVKGITKLIVEESFANKIAIEARAKAEKFDWEIVKEKWLSFLN